MHDTLDAALSSAVLAARHFYNSPTENNEATLNNELSVRIFSFFLREVLSIWKAQEGKV